MKSYFNSKKVAGISFALEKTPHNIESKPYRSFDVGTLPFLCSG